MLLSSGKTHQRRQADRHVLILSQHVAIGKKGWAGSSVRCIDGVVEWGLGVYTV